jgi:hypothetical protein
MGRELGKIGCAATYLTIEEEAKLRAKKQTLKKQGRRKHRRHQINFQRNPRICHTFSASDANSSTITQPPRSFCCIASMQSNWRVLRVLQMPCGKKIKRLVYSCQCKRRVTK